MQLRRSRLHMSAVVTRMHACTLHRRHFDNDASLTLSMLPYRRIQEIEFEVILSYLTVAYRTHAMLLSVSKPQNPHVSEHTTASLLRR